MRYCINCGRRPHEQPILRIVTLSPDVGVCLKCSDELTRRDVPLLDFGREADRQMATTTEYQHFLAREAAGQRSPKCTHCPNPVIIDMRGKYPMFCSTCQREYNQLFEVYE